MCDTLCALTPAGTLFAKNSDRPPGEIQVVEDHPPRPAGGTLRTQYLELPDLGAFRLTGSRPTWLWGFEHGVNEHGVAIGNEKLYTSGRPRLRAPALLGMDLVRLGLERARTADEALDVLTGLVEAHGQGGSGEADRDAPYDSSFLVGDPGAAWVLETCDRTWVARPVAAHAAISNRITLRRDWTRGSPDVEPGTDFTEFLHPTVPTSIADHRLAVTRDRVAAGAALEPAAVVATLRDHGGATWGAPGGPAAAVEPPRAPGPDHRGVTVCMHVPGHQATTAALVARLTPDPDERRAWIALGSPCVSVFVPTFPAVGTPRPLGDPTTWARFAALRDHVDADPGRITGVRRHLDPVEDALWERADAVADGGDSARRGYTATAFESVAAALTDLGF